MVSRLSAGVNGGMIVGRRLARSVLPVPGGPIIKDIMAARRRDQERPLGVILSLDVDEVVFVMRESWKTVSRSTDFGSMSSCPERNPTASARLPIG